MLKAIFSYLITQLPDNVKLVIASCIIAGACLLVNQAMTIDVVKSYVDPIQSANEVKFTTILKHNDLQFQLLRDDIKAVREQNSKILEKL